MKKTGKEEEGRQYLKNNHVKSHYGIDKLQ